MEPFPSSYDTLNLYVEPVLYPVSNKHSICIFKLKLKKRMLAHRWFFRYSPNSYPVHPQSDEHTAHLMSSTTSPLSFLQPITFFLPTTLRASLSTRSTRALLSTLPCPVAARVFPTTSFTFFKMTSYASLIKSTETMQGDTFLYIDEATS
jgi:hypothetical protein